MENIVLRKVMPDDIGQLQEIGRQTFYETFSAENTEENMRKYLEEGFSLEKLRAELNDPNAEFYFATLGDHVIGYLKLNVGPSQTELQDENALEMERIYVLKLFQGKNVGKLLSTKRSRWPDRKMHPISGWVFGKKISVRSVFIKKTGSLSLTGIFSN